MTDTLDRFVTAQAPVFDAVLRELDAGAKTSHWMWFVFPQIAGLGHSAMARRYAIASLAQARAYLAHSLLGPRLDRCIAAVLAHCDLHSDLDVVRMFGAVDAIKLRSSLTLFEAAGGGDAFRDALERLFDGERDAATLALLAR